MRKVASPDIKEMHSPNGPGHTTKWRFVLSTKKGPMILVTQEARLWVDARITVALLYPGFDVQAWIE